MLVPRESEWKYSDRGKQPPDDWRNLGFDDHDWSSALARLGYGGDGEKSRLNFGPDTNRKYTTTYFRKTFQVDQPDGIVKLVLRLQRDDGAIVYLNGQEVARDAMPDGPVTFDTFASVTASDEAERRFVEFDVLTPQLNQGTNVIAAEVHQVTLNSSDLGFDLEVEAYRGLAETAPSADALESVEMRLSIPADLRAVLWISRGARHRQNADLLRAGEALDGARGRTRGIRSVWSGRRRGHRTQTAARWLAFVHARDQAPQGR
jgi:hypothetical protein